MKTLRRSPAIALLALSLPLAGCTAPGIRSAQRRNMNAQAADRPGVSPTFLTEVSGDCHRRQDPQSLASGGSGDELPIRRVASRTDSLPGQSDQSKLITALPYVKSEEGSLSDNSGEPSLVESVNGLVKMDDWVEIYAPKNHGRSFAAQMSPNAKPGLNVLMIKNLPAGTKTASVWVSEWVDGQSVANRALFETMSVQLFDHGTKCRVVFKHNWNTPLPAGANIILD